MKPRYEKAVPPKYETREKGKDDEGKKESKGTSVNRG